MDGDTDGGHAADFFDYWWAWKFSDAFELQMGKRKVTASRQWLLGARRTGFADRPMATDFFRPDRTVGLFGDGTLGETGHYEVMVGNGYRTANLNETATDNRLAFAATQYWDLLGPFGGQIVDFKGSCEPLVRFGHSFVYSAQRDNTTGSPLPETDFVRLADGTRLTDTSAFSHRGGTVSTFDVFLYTVDAAFKYRGFSVTAEAYFRWIGELQGDGPVPVGDVYQDGFFLEGGATS